MGNRVSIKFVNEGEQSPVLFSHWGGIEFRDDAMEYAHELKDWLKEQHEGISDPIGRLEPGTVMVDFIRHITKGMERVTGDLYLTRNESEGDDSDNGHFEIDLAIREAKK